MGYYQIMAENSDIDVNITDLALIKTAEYVAQTTDCGARFHP